MDLTPDILRTFIAAAHALSFTQAAQTVNLTQSAVSTQMRKLEENLGKPLFSRGARGVELTAHGEYFLKSANRLLQLHNETLAAFKEPEMIGLIRVGSAEDYATLHLPGILKRFAAQYPLVQVDLYCDLSNDLLTMLQQGKLDLCLRNTPGNEPGGEFLREEPIIWAGPKDSEPEKKSPLPIAVFHEGCIYRQWAIQALEREHINYRIAYSSPSISGILAAVKSGLAIAPIGSSTLLSEFRTIPNTILPALPSAKVYLHTSKTQKNRVLGLLARYIIDEFRSINREPSQLRSIG